KEYLCKEPPSDEPQLHTNLTPLLTTLSLRGSLRLLAQSTLWKTQRVGRDFSKPFLITSRASYLVRTYSKPSHFRHSLQRLLMFTSGHAEKQFGRRRQSRRTSRRRRPLKKRG